MVNYKCECCKYNTENITNYKRHLLTQKHINNNKFIQIENKIKHMLSSGLNNLNFNDFCIYIIKNNIKIKKNDIYKLQCIQKRLFLLN